MSTDRDRLIAVVFDEIDEVLQALEDSKLTLLSARNLLDQLQDIDRDIDDEPIAPLDDDGEPVTEPELDE